MLSLSVFVPITLILLISIYTDLKKRLIYDWITFPGMFYFLIYHLIAHFDTISYYLLGFLLLGGISLFLAVISNGRIGGGDIKLFSLLGLALGWEVGIVVYFFSYLCASLVALPYLIAQKFFLKGQLSNELPMAPFIGLGTLLAYLFKLFF